MNRQIIHIDMDAFYASVEQRDNINLRARPVVVGGKHSRGVVTTASYEARKYGVHSAMSAKMARKLCPSCIFLSVNMKKYREVSKQIHRILKRYSKKIEPISIDEAFLDVTGENALKIAKKIKDDIFKELQLTASVGISINKFLAKLASDIDKPNGLTIIRGGEIVEFLRPLSVSYLWGVGPKMEKELNKIGIYHIGDIQEYDSRVLESLFGKRGREIYDFSHGIDLRPVEVGISSKSIGEEETFSKDIDDRNILIEKLECFSVNLTNKLEAKGYLIKTITVKIKYSDFTVETRGITLSIPTNDYELIFRVSRQLLLKKFNFNKNVRLIGLSLSNLIHSDDPMQLSMDM